MPKAADCTAQGYPTPICGDLDVSAIDLGVPVQLSSYTRSYPALERALSTMTASCVITDVVDLMGLCVRAAVPPLGAEAEAGLGEVRCGCRGAGLLLGR